MFASAARSGYKTMSVSAAREKKILSVLEPKGWKNVKGGTTSPQSLEGVFEGAITGRGIYHSRTSYTHTINKRFWKPYVKRMTHHSDVLDASFRMPTVVRALRTIHKYGSFDNYLLNLPPNLLSRDTTKIRDTIRTVLQTKLDLLPPSAKILPIGITSGLSVNDRVRPPQHVLGDTLVKSGTARVDAWGAGAPVTVGNNIRYEKKWFKTGREKFGRGSAWRRQVLAIRVKGGGYASGTDAWARLDGEGKLVQGGVAVVTESGEERVKRLAREMRDKLRFGNGPKV